MEKLFATVLGFFGSFGASAGTTACWLWFYDEPNAPASIIEK